MINQQLLEKKLANLPLGKITFREEVDSTNDLAASFLDKGFPDASLIITNQQTRGRGRGGRHWFTPPDSALAFSIIFSKIQSQLNNESIPLFSGLGALAVCKALEVKYNLHPKIKWPNDVLLEEKKTCGILAEAHWQGDHLQGVILGIGINLAPSSVPDEKDLNFPATCIENHLDKTVNRLELLRIILTKTLEEKKRITTPSFIRDWENRLAYIGKTVQLIENEKRISNGVVLGLEDSGKLILKIDDGKLKSFSAGEISLRPLVDRGVK